jgi:hypothetical protein
MRATPPNDNQAKPGQRPDVPALPVNPATGPTERPAAVPAPTCEAGDAPRSEGGVRACTVKRG